MDRSFRAATCNVLTECYRRAAFFEAYAPALYGVLQAGHRKLADLTIAICEWLAQTFGIAARRIRAVSLDNAGSKAELLVHLCRQLGAGRYISPIGSHDYLACFDTFAKAGIELCYHAYEHPTYDQLHGPFLPFMAAIDLLFNVGPDSLAVIRAGQAQRSLRASYDAASRYRASSWRLETCST